MSSPDRPVHGVARVVAHVERTSDPSVLRWVVHEPALPAMPASLAPPAGEPWADGRVVGVRRMGGDLYVKVAAGSEWTALAPEVDAALRSALAVPAPWLLASDAEQGECDSGWALVVQSPSAEPQHGCRNCAHAGGCSSSA